LALRKFLLAIAPLLVVPALACSGDDDGGSAQTAPTAAPAASTSVPSGGAGGAPTATTAGGAPGAVTATATTAPASSATQPASGGAPSASEINAFAQAFRNVKSFRITMAVQSGTTVTPQGTMEYVLPDKLHASFQGYGLISIGADSYVKIGPAWTKQTGAIAPGQFFNFSDLQRLSADAQISRYVRGGTDVVNGQNCQLYTLTEASGTTELCIGNNLPQRIVTTTGTQKLILTFSDYDRVPDIRPPI
jgi:hypothetical protein